MMNENGQQRLTLRLLGEPSILYRGTSLAGLLAQKEQALLVYLVCQAEQRFSREHLSTLLWGDVPQSRARYNLRRALWHLRRAFDETDLSPDDCLVVEGSWVSVPSSAPCWADVHDFEQVLHTCFQDPQSRFSVASEGIRCIRRALDLYRGEFLAGFSVSHAPGFEEWVIVERERLFLLLLRALTSLIQGFIARNERDEAIAACQRLLVLDPLQEDIHRLLMRLYWETGQRAQALRQYNTYHDLLRRELNIEPLEDTQELYQRILQQEAAPTSTASSLVLTSRVTPPAPAPEALARPRLFSLLDRGLTVRLTLLSAPPGYGKTTLLAQWLAARSAEYGTDPPRGKRAREPLFAWYQVSEADNAPLGLVEGMAASVDQLHLEAASSLQTQVHDVTALQRDPRQAAGLLLRAVAALDPTPFLIILDDVEHLTDPDSQEVLQYIVEHLPANGHLYLLTRVAPPLPLPRLRVRGQLLEIRAPELRFTDEEAATFLKQVSGPNLSRTEIAELTSRAEGWAAPLWLASSALGRFAASLDDVWEGVFAYLREEVLALQPPEIRDLLLRSAVLDRLSPSLCQAILDVPKDSDSPGEWLAELERRNLFLRRVPLQPQSAEPQYTYHPLFLTFLRAELPSYLSNGEVEALHRRAMAVWEQQGDLEQALFHCFKTGDQPGIARLFEQIAPAYLHQGRLEPLARWLDQLGPAVQDQHPQLTLHAGRIRQAEGRVEEARQLYQRAALGFEVSQDRASQGDSLLALAELELLRGRYAEGIQLGERAIDCWDEADIRRRASALRAVGHMQASKGNLPDAEAILGEAEGLILERGHPLLAFQVLRTRAWVAYVQGRYRRAMALNHLAEREAGPEVSPEIRATTYNPVPSVLREWGEAEIAWTATQQRIKAARQLHQRLVLAQAHTELGNLYLDQARVAEAETAFRHAVAEAKAAGGDGLHRLCGEVHLVYACVLQDHGAEAGELAEAALHRCESRGADLLDLAIAQTAVALAHTCDPDSAQAFRQSIEAYRTYRRLGVMYGAFVSGTLASLTALRAKHRRQARRYLAEALALAAAEGYLQTIVASRQLLLPLLLFGLGEGIEVRFIGRALARMEPEVLADVERMTRAAEPAVRQRAAVVLAVIGAERRAARTAAPDTALAALERLVRDPDPTVRAAAAHARRSLRLRSRTRP